MNASNVDRWRIMSKRFHAAWLLAFALFSSNAVKATEAVPVLLPELPATFSGILPCADCEGIDTRITLRADGTFFSQQLYLGEAKPNHAADLGKWVMSHYGNVLVIRGQQSEPRYFLVKYPDTLEMLDLEARTIFSELNYKLTRRAEVDVLNLKLFPLRGLYRYYADAGRFTECVSGLEFPVLTMGDNAELERAYLKLRDDQGQALLATLYAQIKPASSMEGKQIVSSVNPLRFEGIERANCPPTLFSAHLTDQFWTLVQLRGKPVVLPDSGRAPGLMFHSENGRLSGSGGCNQLLGSYSVDQNLIQTKMIAATRMACLQPGNVDDELIATLTQVKSWNILGQRMELYDQLGRLLVRFEAR